MLEISLILIGLVFFVWLFVLVRQVQRGLDAGHEALARPVVPVSLPPSDDAMIVAEGRGHIVFANEPARRWFGLDGETPTLTVMARRCALPRRSTTCSHGPDGLRCASARARWRPSPTPSPPRTASAWCCCCAS